FYTEVSYEKPLQFDVMSADEIVMGVVSLRQLKLETLIKLRQSHKTITLVIKEDKFNNHPKLLSELRKIGINFKLLPVNTFSFVVCDEQIVWYGNLKFFATTNKNTTTLRLLNKEIAQKVVEQYLDRN